MPDDGNRYEVLDGELFVTPQAAAAHQWISTLLSSALVQYCLRHDLGWVAGPGAVVFGDSELQPDVQVIPQPGGPRDDAEWKELPTPLLVVEVLSESTRQRDLKKKKAAYLRLGIPTYWIVDRYQRCVIMATGRPGESAIVTDVLRWQPRGDLPALEIPLESVFAKGT